MICPHCNKEFRPTDMYIPSPRQLHRNRGERIYEISSWNVPYSTGKYFVSSDDVPKEEVEVYAVEHTHFPFWPLIYVGKLWSKDTWDD